MTSKTLTGILLDEQAQLSLQDLCLACSTSTEWVVELVDEGEDRRVAQTADLHQFDRAFLDTLGSRRADVVLVDLFEEHGAVVPDSAAE